MEENLEKETKKVLVVDDEQAIIDVLVYNLKKEGYETLEATDGVTAVNMALEQKPDLMLLDIMLPKMDGLTVCKRVKNYLNIPILILPPDLFTINVCERTFFCFPCVCRNR